MFVLVIGGGKVGYYLAKELLGSGHEVVVMEKDRARASSMRDCFAIAGGSVPAGDEKPM